MFFSQNGQDEFLDTQVFNGMADGFFLDIGAYDGKRLSNTYFFEKKRNWTGICLEPNPRVFTELIKNRSCVCINAAIAPKDGKSDFLDLEGVEVLGGLVNKFDKRHLKRIDVDFSRYNGLSKKIIKVTTLNINKILEQQKVKRINYCSIDTEGGELEIIKSINLLKYEVDVFSVENNYPEKNKTKKWLKDISGNSIGGYLITKGFKKIHQLGSDEIYCNKNYSFREV